MVGVAAAKRAERLVHPDVPGNVAGRMVQERGDAREEIIAAPHTLLLSLSIERSASMPLEGRGVVAREDADGTLRVPYSLPSDAALQTTRAPTQHQFLRQIQPTDQALIATGQPFPAREAAFRASLVAPSVERPCRPW